MTEAVDRRVHSRFLNFWMTCSLKWLRTLHVRRGKCLCMKGFVFMQVGGRMVYSTCSFNPVENEAVVAAVLKATKGAIQLVDVSETLPALKRKHGLLSWKVSNPSHDHDMKVLRTCTA